MANILLLQTDDQLAESSARYLKLKGHRVSIHKDPQTAVMQADASRPDAIVLELMLAGRSGAEFLYELRSYPDWQDIPVIVTGNLFLSQIETFLESFNHLNVSSYLTRQTTGLSKLAAEIDSLLG